MKTSLVLNIGIIEGDDKRVLENYIDSRVFRQRKSYDEYYIDINGTELDLDIRDLMILAENFLVDVFSDYVELSSRN